jgi:tetratricopeptide (TPR) repeat protein
VVYDSGYYAYSNPYYTEPVVLMADSGVETVIDYSQPIEQVPYTSNYSSDGQEVAPEEVAPPITDNGIQTLDESREAFWAGNYQQALKGANAALASAPNDPAVHEFRALVLFAQGSYREAAAALYSVLSVGPPWDWTTMSGLYDNTDAYTKQLRALEAYVDQHMDAAYGHFLLAYHYLVAGYNDETIAELKEVIRLEPSDQISANLLAMLDGSADSKTDSSTAPASGELLSASAEDAPIVQFDPEKLFGTWIAQRKGNPSIMLTLNKDQQFTWTVGQGDSKREMGGEFSLGGDNLALQPEGNNAMVGTVSKVTARGFNFRIIGAPPGDQGLDFTRK